MTTTETDVCELIRDAMCDYESMMYTTRFEDAGVMTDDTGFVVKMDNGSEFQITVKEMV